ncbi:MAG: hypothetical protein HFE79_04485 [Ruminiclostridium sp.]|nr:hypothetical protein [Ruminiclostridium sp.]
MINMQSIAVNQNRIPISKTSSNQASVRSFAEYLEDSSSNEVKIPSSWCLDTDKYGAGIDKAVEYMKKELGIDPYNRKPTHEITAEQMQWIKSRHNLDDIYKTANGTDNDGCCSWTMSWWDENFLSDLVYLNVISPEDAKSFGWIAFPKSESGKAYAVSDCGNASSGRLSITEVAAKVLQKQQAHIDSIYEKYENDFSLMLKQDKEYLEAAQKLLEKNQIWYDLLMRLSN